MLMSNLLKLIVPFMAVKYAPTFSYCIPPPFEGPHKEMLPTPPLILLGRKSYFV